MTQMIKKFQVAVKLGDLRFCLKTMLRYFVAFSNENRGGPDPDRTGDLLHAMHESIYHTFKSEIIYLIDITKNCIVRPLHISTSIIAYQCSRMQSKAYTYGGRNGGFLEINSRGLQIEKVSNVKDRLSLYKNKFYSTRLLNSSSGESFINWGHQWRVLI